MNEPVGKPSMSKSNVLTKIGGVVLVSAIVAGGAWWIGGNIESPSPSASETHSSVLPVPEADPKFHATITLRNLRKDKAIARAIRSYREPTFLIEIQAEHLAKLPAGSTYAAWIFKEEAGSDPLYIGELRSNDTEKDIFKAGLALSRKDFPDYKKMIITIEKVYDPKPEERIFEGSFK